MTRTLRQNMPEDDWDRLASLADDAGVPVGSYTRDVLSAWAALSDETVAALAAEASRHNQTPAERVTYLLTRKYGATE